MRRPGEYSLWIDDAMYLECNDIYCGRGEWYVCRNSTSCVVQFVLCLMQLVCHATAVDVVSILTGFHSATAP